MEQKKIGLFLKKLRNENNLTQEILAEKLNVSSRTVSRWETGSNMPDISMLNYLNSIRLAYLRLSMEKGKVRK